jgi:hypothetical protein
VFHGLGIVSPAFACDVGTSILTVGAGGIHGV